MEFDKEDREAREALRETAAIVWFFPLALTKAIAMEITQFVKRITKALRPNRDDRG